MKNNPLINHYLVVEGLVPNHHKALFLCSFVLYSHILFVRLIGMRRVTFLFGALNLCVRTQLHCLEELYTMDKPIYNLCHSPLWIC